MRASAPRPGRRRVLIGEARLLDAHGEEAARGTGYEVLLYHCMRGDATLFTRNDLVERAWRITQPILDTWAANPPKDFPNYQAGSWGPKSVFALIERGATFWHPSYRT